MSRKNAPEYASVDEYIKKASPEAREMLTQMRAIFRKAAPHAVETISYNMPYYYYNGPLGGFAAYKRHVTLFGAFPDSMKKALSTYKTGRGSVRFPLNKPLPVSLVTKLVKAHLGTNEAVTEGVGMH